jgi:hypothetical protein
MAGASGTVVREHARAVLGALDAWAGCDPGGLPADVMVEALGALQRAKAKLAAFELRLLAGAGDVARAAGHRDEAAWYAAATRTDPGTARAVQHTARALQHAAGVAGALGAGEVSERQARVVLDSLGRLPAVSEPLRRKAEDRLLDHARHLTPAQLAIRGKGILDEVDPAGEHRQLGHALADEASHAWAATRIAFRDQGDGTTDVQGTLPTPVASRMRTVLEAYASPRAQHARGSTSAGTANATGPSRTATTPAVAGAGGWLPHATRLGHALCTLLEGLDPQALPRHGGAATTVIVTIDRHDLTRDLGTARLIDSTHDGPAHDDSTHAEPLHGPGTPISAGEARRLACNTGILPAVLGTASQVLDLGRRTRLFTPAQITALRIRDSGCRAQGCTIPATWCEAHHLDPWSRGGPTDLTNGILLCPHHHHLIHDPTYHHQHPPDGDIRFRRHAEDVAPSAVAARSRGVAA